MAFWVTILSDAGEQAEVWCAVERWLCNGPSALPM